MIENTETAIATTPNNPYLPAMSIQQVIERRTAIVKFVQSAMTPEHDFGKIPGTDKDTLYKPGAEKLCTLFGLTTRFQVVSQTEDWTGADHAGEPFFSYDYRCQLWRGPLLIAESDGSANSFEKKYRYRGAKRSCPSCGQTAIIKGKEEYGGGWLCFKKNGGCGAKFRDGDASIESQKLGQVPNPDICDMPNTLRKMAQKRAFVGTTLIAVNASEFFTQDIEDMSMGDVVESTARPVEKAVSKPAQAPAQKPVSKADEQPKDLWPKDVARNPVNITKDDIRALGKAAREYEATAGAKVAAEISAACSLGVDVFMHWDAKSSAERMQAKQYLDKVLAMAKTEEDEKVLAAAQNLPGAEISELREAARVEASVQY